MKKSLALIGILLVCCLFVGGVSASADGGLHDGTYLIYDSADLVAFASYINGDVTHVSTNAKLMADIDLSSVSSWTPIGTSSNQYAGTFDGNGHTISNFNSNNLFIQLTSAGTIQNVKFVSCTFGNLLSRGGNCYKIYLNNCIGNYGILFASCNNAKDILIEDTQFGLTTKRSNWQSVGFFSDSTVLSNVIVTSDCSISVNTPSSTYEEIYVGTFRAVISFGDTSNQKVINVVTEISSIQVSISSGSVKSGAICGIYDSSRSVATFSNCYRTTQNFPSSGHYPVNGDYVSSASLTQSFYTTASNWDASYPWDFSNTWYWDSTANLPKLRVFLHPPTVSEITINADKGAINTQYSPQITPTISNLGGASTVYYKVQVSTDGTTYTDASSVSSTTTTGQKSAITTTAFTDTTARTHYYRVIATSLNGVWTSDKAGTSTTVTFTTYAPPSTPTALNPDPNQIGTGVAISVGLSATSVPTAPSGLTYTYQWHYASSTTPSAGDTAIGTAQTTYQDSTWSISSSTFTSPTTKYLYLKITDSLSQTTYSNRVELQVMDLSATANFNPQEYQGLEDTIRLAVIGNQPLMTYQWYYKTTGDYQPIDQATTQYYQTTANALRVSSGTAIKFKCVVSYMGSTYNLETGTLTPYASPTPNVPGHPLQPISIPYTITLTATCSDESLVSSYKWQLQSGSSWNDVSTGAQYSPTISTAGNHVYRFVAIGINGHDVPSESVTVRAGYAPTASITSPETGTLYQAGERIDLSATVGGTSASYTWDFGSNVAEHGTQSGTISSQSTTISTYVKFKTTPKGAKTIKLTVSNDFGTSAVYTISVINGASTVRPTAHSTVAPIEDKNGIYDLINASQPQSTQNQMPNLGGMVEQVTKPFTSIVGEWFYLVIFAVPYLIIFIRQKNLLIPSILGVMFAAFLFILLPGAAMRAAIGILVLSVAGGIFGLYVKRQS